MRTHRAALEHGGADGILDHLPAIVYVADAHGRVTYANQAWGQVTGAAPAGPEGMHEAWMAAIDPGDRDAFLERVASAMRSCQSYQAEWRLRATTGASRWVLDSAQPLVSGGRCTGLVGALTDLTARRSLEESLQVANERLREADRARALFLNAASHELRTPLTPLLMQLQLSLRPGLDEARREHGLRVALRSAERLETLVSDLLNVGRLEVGVPDIVHAALDLREVAAEVVQAFVVPAAAKGVDLVLAPGGPAPVHGDHRRLAQVAGNLVSNAIRFTPRGGRIDVEARLDGPDAVLRVRDTGSGIAPHRMGELFRPFSQLHENKFDVGSGLGLFISKGIALAHGGSLRALSPGLGQGSTFELRIPREAAS